jgi:hypothetical protein
LRMIWTQEVALHVVDQEHAAVGIRLPVHSAAGQAVSLRGPHF